MLEVKNFIVICDEWILFELFFFEIYVGELV